MKTNLIKKITAAILAITLLGGCAAQKPTDGDTADAEPSQTQETTEITSETSIDEPVEYPSEEYETQPYFREEITTTQTHYTHAALCGSIIVKQDGSTRYSYKKKCDTCGYVFPGTTSTSNSSGTMSSGYRCPKCNTNGKIEIETYRN